MKSEKLIVRISGIIDERFDFSAAVPTSHQELRVDCSGVERINSAGVRNWTRFFRDLARKGIRVRYRALTSALVDTLQIAPFIGKEEIESVQISLLCPCCRRSWLSAVDVDAWNESVRRLERHSCPECLQRLRCDTDSGTLLFIDGCRARREYAHPG